MSTPNDPAIEEIFQSFLREVGDICLLQAYMSRDPVASQLLVQRHDERLRRIFALRCFEAMQLEEPGPLHHWHLFGGRRDRIVDAQHTYCDIVIRQTLEEARQWDLAELRALRDWAVLHRPGHDGRPVPVKKRVIPWTSAVLRSVPEPGETDIPTAILDRLRFIHTLLCSLHKPDPVLIRKVRHVLKLEPTLELEPGEAWSDAAIRAIGACRRSDEQAWIALISHCRMAYASSPSKAWLATGRKLLHAVGEQTFCEHVCEWFGFVDLPRTLPSPPNQYRVYMDHGIIDIHMDVLRGLCWLTTLVDHPDLPRSLSGLALSAYRKIPRVGHRAIKVGNAAIWALGQCPGANAEAALGQLVLLRIKVKFGSGQRQISSAIHAAITRKNIPPEEVDELGVPTFGMKDVGLLEVDLGSCTGQFRFSPESGADTRYIAHDSAGAPSGRGSNSPPAAARASHAAAIREFKTAITDITRMISAQRERLDSMFLRKEALPFRRWKERYLDHPVVGVAARRLIWTIEDVNGTASQRVTWLDDVGLVDQSGNPVPSPGPDARVRLWHPIESAVEDVLRWRMFFESRSLRQPFKQAHREVYLLTEAERTTATYSNRFAAHILRQRPFHSLCAQRGWKDQLRLPVDQEARHSTRHLAEWGIRAEYVVEGVEGPEDDDFSDESVAYELVSTDQVRFFSVESAADDVGETSLPLALVPPLIFSEIMRDIDLFVGVCSVGNDPRWGDRGPLRPFREYWWTYAFGELSVSAKQRHDLLSRILPRLAIAPLCTLEERYLSVRGRIRTYRIHLGSGNILMSPNDTYLCIVANEGVSGDIYLPFEGDGTLSIILSKAMMLAEDHRITDRTISKQIRG